MFLFTLFVLYFQEMCTLPSLVQTVAISISVKVTDQCRRTLSSNRTHAQLPPNLTQPSVSVTTKTRLTVHQTQYQSTVRLEVSYTNCL